MFNIKSGHLLHHRVEGSQVRFVLPRLIGEGFPWHIEAYESRQIFNRLDKIKVVEAKEAELKEALAMKAELTKWERSLNAKSDELSVMGKELKEKMDKLSKFMAGD